MSSAGSPSGSATWDAAWRRGSAVEGDDGLRTCSSWETPSPLVPPAPVPPCAAAHYRRKGVSFHLATTLKRAPEAATRPSMSSGSPVKTEPESASRQRPRTRPRRQRCAWLRASGRPRVPSAHRAVRRCNRGGTSTVAPSTQSDYREPGLRQAPPARRHPAGGTCAQPKLAGRYGPPQRAQPRRRPPHSFRASRPPAAARCAHCLAGGRQG